MITKQQLVEITEKNIKSNLKGLFGSIKSDYKGKPYNEVYVYEFKDMYYDIGYFLYKLVNRDDFVISLEQLTGALMYIWSCTFRLNSVNNINVFEDIANSILLNIERVIG